ncbi:MAG: hypothetical protein Q4D50_09480 [Eubacteriales bacterium]|nr:hypothetical protein [Eubacteriales bacterium]
MSPKKSLADQIVDTTVEETVCLPGEQVPLGEIKNKIQKLENTFCGLLQKAAEDPNADYTGQFRANTEELASLKQQRDALEAYLREQGTAYDRIQVTKDLLRGYSPHLTQWDDNLIRQLVHTVKVLSAERILVCLANGTEIQWQI